MDDDYYGLLSQGTVRVQGVPVLDLEHLPLFKMKAWLELAAARQRGDHVNSGDVTKHKNDVFRLAAAIDPDRRVALPGAVRQDVTAFLDHVPLTPNDMANLGIRGYTPDELRELINSVYDA